MVSEANTFRDAHGRMEIALQCAWNRGAVESSPLAAAAPDERRSPHDLLAHLRGLLPKRKIDPDPKRRTD
jgi:hypothetical protein